MAAVQVVPIIDWNDMAIEFIPESHRTPRFIAWMQGNLSGSIGWINKNFWNYCYGDQNSNPWSSIITYQLLDTVITYYGVYVSTYSVNLGNSPDIQLQYSSLSTYSIGNCIIYGGTFENPIYYVCNTNIAVAESFNPDHWTLLTGYIWYKIAPSYIGAQERAQYSAQKLVMEYALNRWFRTNFRQPTALQNGEISTPYGIWYTPVSDIYITTKPIVFYSPAIYDIPSAIIYDIPYVGSSVYDTVVSSTDTTYEFVVWVPSSLAAALGSSYIQIISSVVNLMAICGTIFEIQTY